MCFTQYIVQMFVIYYYLSHVPLKVSIAVPFLHQEQGVGVLGNENKFENEFSLFL